MLIILLTVYRMTRFCEIKKKERVSLIFAQSFHPVSNLVNTKYSCHPVMNYYFTLQYKMLNRHIKAFGLPPILGYVLAIIGFIGLSIYLFYKTKFAVYIYPFFAISTLTLLSESRRNDFLKTCFTASNYYKVRCLENGLVILPFLLFLGYKAEWLMILGLVLIALVMGRFSFNHQLNQTIPTPFYHYPFEFLVGFRKALVFIFFAFFLTYMSISVGNFNLGVFALLLVIGTCFAFYTTPDSQYYVWIFSTRAKGFLFQKGSVALGYTTLLALPILLSLSFFFPKNLGILWGIHLLGLLYLWVIILGKYAAFPKSMNLPETLLITLSIFFPPFLLFLIPYFYKKAIRQLNQVLGMQSS